MAAADGRLRWDGDPAAHRAFIFIVQPPPRCSQTGCQPGTCRLCPGQPCSPPLLTSSGCVSPTQDTPLYLGKSYLWLPTLSVLTERLHTHTKGISKLKLCTNSLNIIHLIQAKLKTRTLTTPEAENTEPQRRCALCFVVNVHSTLVLWIKGSFEKLKTDLAHPKIEPSKTTNSRVCSFYPFLTGVTAASATG